MLKSLSWKLVLKLFGAAYLVSLMLKLRKLWAGWNRMKKLAYNLPSPPRPKHLDNSLDVYGALDREFPEGISFSTRTVAPHFIKSVQNNFKKYAKNEGLLAIWALNPRIVPFPAFSVYIKDMKLAREILSTKMMPLMKKGKAYRISYDLVGDGVLSTTKSVWHSQRVIIERGFTDELINKQFPMVTETANDLLERLRFLHGRDQDADGFLEVDLIEEMLKTTLDVLGRAAFSYNIGSLKVENTREAPLYDAFQVILSTLEARVYGPLKFFSRNWFPSAENRNFSKNIAILNSVITDIIRSRGKEQKSAEPRDLLDILLLESTEDSNGKTINLSEKEILDNMRTILFAGHDTTAAALTWAFYLLSKHPSVAQRILEEFQRDFNSVMSVENLEKCEFLNSVVLEVLRLYPSAGFTRETLEDFMLGKYLIPKGSDIFVLPYLIHRDPSNFENPDDFIPERWMDDKAEKIGLQATLAKATRTKAYLPFSLGKRNCVGRKLALLEIRVIILEVLQNFELKFMENQPNGFQVTPYMGLTAYPKHVHVKMKPRSK